MLMTAKGKDFAQVLDNDGGGGDKVPSVRIQLRLKPEYADRLVEMRKVSRAATVSDVIRDALRVHEYILKALGPEDQLLIRKKDGSTVQILL